MKVITIGRSSENDIVVDDFKVSRVHLQLVFNDGICSIVDLNSSNGTFVNGQKINSEVRLQPNDVVRIGNTTLPWQEYVNTHTTPPNTPTPLKPNNKTWLYVLIGVIALLLVCGGGFAIYYNYQQRVEKEQQELLIQKEKEDSERKEKEKREQEIRDLQRRADQQFQDDLISQKNQLNENVRNTEDERDAARKQNENLNKQLESEWKSKEQLQKEAAAEREAYQARLDSIQEANQASATKTRKQLNKAQAERDEARKSNELMAEFLKESSNLSVIVAKQVCKELKCDLSNNADPKSELTDKFVNSNIRDKQKIINKIQTLKSKEKTVDSSKEKSDSVFN
jgi:pSer/pThr/pTyr-binding forkhead associated (FHA) protein